MNTMKFCLVVAFAAILSGCMGTYFVRPDDSDLHLGKTSINDVYKTLGDPYREYPTSLNDQELMFLSYIYVAVGVSSDFDVTPSRTMRLFFWKGVLVSHVYTSLFISDSSYYDESKRTEIVKGKTTRAEVIKLLGRPSGYGIYPYISDKTGEALIYSHTTSRGEPNTEKLMNKLLKVTVGPNDIVRDIEYSESSS